MTEDTPLPIGPAVLPYGDGAIARALAERDGGVLLQLRDGSWVVATMVDGLFVCPYSRIVSAYDACAPLPSPNQWHSGPPPETVPQGWEMHTRERHPRGLPCFRRYGHGRAYPGGNVIHWILLPAPPAEEVKTDD